MIAQQRDIKIASSDGRTFSAYLTIPTTTPAPALIVVTPIFGVDQEMRDVTDHYADLGFITVTPDIFWRVQAGPLSHKDDAERKQASDRMEKFDVDAGVDDLESVLKAIRAMPEYNGRFGVVGFCFGGRYAFLAAARLGAGAAASFHGASIGKNLGEAKAITCPLSFHFGDNDAAVPMDEVEAIREALRSHDNAEICVYPGVKHGFTHPSRPAYDPAVTKLSEERAFKMFAQLK